MRYPSGCDVSSLKCPLGWCSRHYTTRREGRQVKEDALVPEAHLQCVPLEPESDSLLEASLPSNARSTDKRPLL